MVELVHVGLRFLKPLDASNWQVRGKVARPFERFSLEPVATVAGGARAADLAAIRELVIENQKRAEYQELAGEPILRDLGAGLEAEEGADER